MTPHFEDYAAWLASSNDMLIIASPKGPLPKSEIARLLSTPGPLQSELARIGITTQEHLDFHKLADARLLRGFGQLYQELGQNSDYYPVLGLQAPRTRFKGIVAEAIGTLPAQETPLLEAMAVRSPLPSHILPSKLPHNAPDVLTWRARALAAELAGQDGSSVAPDIIPSRALAPAILLKAAANQACKLSWSPAASRQFSVRMREVADLTNAFLPSDILQNIWVRRDWLPCKNLPEDINRALMLLGAIAEKDWKSMITTSNDWLSRPAQDKVIHDDYADLALSSLLLGFAHGQQWLELQAAEAKFGSSTKSEYVYSFQRKLLQAVAKDQAK